jgi:hypothetical protein
MKEQKQYDFTGALKTIQTDTVEAMVKELQALENDGGEVIHITAIVMTVKLSDPL